MDTEQHERAKKAIRFILEKSGYEVCNEEGNFDLSASKHEQFLVILCSDDKNAVIRFNETEYRIEDESEPCLKLVFTLNSDIKLNGTIVIGPNEFSSIMGQVMLSEITGNEFSLDVFLSPGTHSLPDSTDTFPASLPIEISSEKALRIAGIKGEIRLKMIPYWSYKYSCEGEKKFKEKTVPFSSEAIGSVNGINGALSDIHIESMKPQKIPPSADIVSPSLSMEEAKKKVISHAVKDLTRHIRLKQESGQTIAYEDKVLSPDPDFFTIKMSLFYVPVWQVRGKRIVEINAQSGEILSEPMDEGVEVF